MLIFQSAYVPMGLSKVILFDITFGERDSAFK